MRQAFRKIAAARRYDLRPHHDGLADFAMYVAVLAAIGPVPLAVTINLSINFLRKPLQRDLTAELGCLRSANGWRPGEVTIRCLGVDGPVAHVTSTYSIPPRQPAETGDGE